MTFMRAKVRVGSVAPLRNGDGGTINEQVAFHGVAKSQPYPADGSDEDNTFAKFSPSVGITMTIANPDLLGKLEPGVAYYVDFTPVPVTA